MKAWILNPPFSKEMIKEGRCEQEVSLFQTNYPPFTMGYLAAIIRTKYDVEIIDSIAEKHSKKYICHKINLEKPKFVFVNTTTPTFDSDIDLVKNFLNLSKKTKFYIYGVHASYFSKSMKLGNRVNFIIGEPEKKAFELIGKQNVDFKDFPFPAWNLIDLMKYKIALKNKPFLIVQTSRGCPYSCSFCTAPFYYGKKYRKRDVKNVIEEIKYVKSLGVNDILFYSEIFTFDQNYVMEICREIIKQKIKISWMCNSRVDTVNLKLLKLMKKAGCWLISYGIESSNQELLNISKKNYNCELAKVAILMTKKAKILSIGHFILGLSGETKKSIKSTILYSKKIGLDFAFYYNATPFPGSDLYEEKKDEIISNWQNFEYGNNITNSKLDLNKFQSYAYRSFYINFFRIPTIYKLINVLGVNQIPNIANAGVRSLLKLRKF